MSNILRRVKGSADKNYCLFLKISGRIEQDRKCITVNDIENILLNGLLNGLTGKAIRNF